MEVKSLDMLLIQMCWESIRYLYLFMHKYIHQDRRKWLKYVEPNNSSSKNTNGQDCQLYNWCSNQKVSTARRIWIHGMQRLSKAWSPQEYRKGSTGYKFGDMHHICRLKNQCTTQLFIRLTNIWKNQLQKDCLIWLAVLEILVYDHWPHCSELVVAQYSMARAHGSSGVLFT